MLSYQHAYHAGNFADVHKHLTLFAVIDHLLRKPAPITYFDSHAGRGRYPLMAPETRRLGEYRQGVAPLWQARDALAQEPLLSAWLTALAAMQPDAGTLSHYPGSPAWLSHRLRDQDRLWLFELHPGEHGHLAEQRLGDNVTWLHADGLQGLLDRLPVVTPRLCVLIDPSYERKAEYREVVETLNAAMGKARHAVMLVWYPLLPSGRHRDLLDGVRESGLRKVWRSELTLHAPGEASHGMYGSGVLVINPPWGLDERLAGAMAAVTPRLGPEASYRGNWWVGE
ncbi:23S rRNA (adenine(2030)-N(6))-methyltransferase RlmJ [Halomonas sp. NO4]|uniref:23S rRNA (adenine(2030)-N(6))-methyltransferase RlmJ n=1 Tax=Halomonas sp. NO4 TaxID=2484813 RepID=UPI0013CFBF64|nr:23S rRNA (adenine(2030)-N(6))-methyltransferase RlmJ [Halomonas sp. NO4]